jgi:sugar/nucleoside kinase (ribokinase family)
MTNPESETSTDFVAIGHLSFDINVVDDGAPSSHIPGGASAYAALTARNHDYRSGIVTSIDADYPVAEILTGIDVEVVESEHTATFANYYDNGERTQVLVASGARIPEQSIPANWRKPKILFVGPLLHELPTECVNWFEPELSCLVPSGWLRRWGPDGSITHAAQLPPPRGKKWDIIAISELEFQGMSDEELMNLCDVLCVTDGGRGARVLHNGGWTVIPANPAEPVDLTGAGDTWAVAFALARYEGNSISDAGAYASAAAALGIEAVGMSGCPTREAVEARLNG